MTHRVPPPREPAGESKDGASERSPVSWGLPAFAHNFPDDPKLVALVEAFAAGNYAAVRVGAPELASNTDDERVKAAALLLRSRIEPDPTSHVFFALAAALLVFLMVWWVTHDGPEGQGPRTPEPPPAAERVK